MTKNTIHSQFLIHWTGKDFDPGDGMDDIIRKKYVDRLKDYLQKGLYMKPGNEQFYGVGGV